jgi:hypothetical protein
MWERAEGVAGPRCRSPQRRFLDDGLGEIRLRMDHVQLLRSAGQPNSRPGRLWTWCADGTGGGEVKALLGTGGRVRLVASTARLHRFEDLGQGSRARRLPRRGVRRVGRSLRVRKAGRNRVVHGVRRGRITFTAVVPRRTAASGKRLRRTLKLAELR